MCAWPAETTSPLPSARTGESTGRRGRRWRNESECKSQKRHETDCLTPLTPSSPSSTARWRPRVAERTGIAWTGATWTPIRARHRVTGKVGWYCQRISEGCRHCYAATMNGWRGNGVDYTVPALTDVELFLDERILAAPGAGPGGGGAFPARALRGGPPPRAHAAPDLRLLDDRPVRRVDARRVDRQDLRGDGAGAAAHVSGSD